MLAPLSRARQFSLTITNNMTIDRHLSSGVPRHFYGGNSETNVADSAISIS
jgi:hypothetical protein